MKKSVLVVLGLMMMSVFTSCGFVTQEETTYVVECGIVTNETIYTAADMMSDGLSFSDFCKVRDYLYKNTIDGYEVEYDVTFEELESMLLQVSYTEGAEAANVTQKRGFKILCFNHRYDDDVKIWMSVVETELLY